MSSSPLKTVIHPATGGTVKMGRKRPAPHDARRMHLTAGQYLKPSLLSGRPHKTNYRQKAHDVLHQVLLNDKLGCCTVSGMFHLEGQFLANSGQVVGPIPDTLVERVYERSGYVPGRADTDNGWDEISALDSWRTSGLGLGGPIAGWLSANPDNPEELKTLLWLFENLYFGWELPDAWVDADMPSTDGFVWDVAGSPDTSNGHCTVGLDYDDGEDGVIFDTWGLVGRVTWRAVRKYCDGSTGGEIHAVISTDSLVKATRKAPSGFDWPQLVADFHERGGNVEPLKYLIA